MEVRKVMIEEGGREENAYRTTNLLFLYYFLSDKPHKIVKVYVATIKLVGVVVCEECIGYFSHSHFKAVHHFYYEECVCVCVDWQGL